MKKLGTVAATMAALMMAATPAIAAAPQSPASKLSVVNAAKRTGAPLASANRAEGESSWIWIGLGAVAVIVGIILIADDDDEPSSP
ncbi:hypothetical protein [Sphingomonas sp. LaA6.9]|uniref:hypothetical protein n=1 Tax=Sphingomonas sp. LaA6.9 TaxID=2919914 RepID=UPI001F4F7D28|nr:hypothetical protein [Sphingomonas sp. LaA6.9]MCJ8158224.1 hypothetical protein [Sphingomonas sp. LaA6.9]